MSFIIFFSAELKWEALLSFYGYWRVFANFESFVEQQKIEKYDVLTNLIPNRSVAGICCSYVPVESRNVMMTFAIAAVTLSFFVLLLAALVLEANVITFKSLFASLFYPLLAGIYFSFKWYKLVFNEDRTEYVFKSVCGSDHSAIWLYPRLHTH